ncbi:MAG TPA: DUF2157 domain-containing protein [Chitinophagales bacterium]|nr:DUF2157 domain-containing protein [Chitinophagales bacterium]
MQKLDRDDIHILGRNSSWSAEGVGRALNDNVYNHATAWQKFLQLFFISLGVCFTSAGIIFFFAYNWDDLGKFAKMGLVGGAMLSVVAVVVFSKASALIKNILLTGAAVLVGALFAVYGQIYQTGADTYELFIAWTAFVTLWVLSAGFAPLWLLYIILINTTLVLYLGQAMHNLQPTDLCLILFGLNTFTLVASIVLHSLKPEVNIPGWFTNILALVCVSISTAGIVAGIFDKETMLGAFLLVIAIAYPAAVGYGIKAKRVFYPASIAFSLIVIISAFMLEASHDTGMFLLVSIFIIAAVSFTIWQIVKLQKKWADA